MKNGCEFEIEKKLRTGIPLKKYKIPKQISFVNVIERSQNGVFQIGFQYEDAQNVH